METKANKRKYNRYGDGSVYQRQTDGRWVTKYKPRNSAKYIVRSSKTKKEANQKLEDLKRLEALGIHNATQKIEDIMETWLQAFRSKSLRVGSYDAVESNYLCHIKPFIGDYQPHHITTIMLQKLINERATKLGYSALSKVYGLLKQFFKYLFDEGLIEKNFMNSVLMPKEENTVQSENKIYFLEIDEVLRIEKVVEEQVAKAWKSDKWQKNSVARYGYIVLFLINTGLRKGEMLALEWEDLLYQEQRVNINKSLSQVKNRNRKDGESIHKWHLGAPKSKKGIRQTSFNKKARYYMTELKKIQSHLDYTDKKYIARTPTGQPLSKSTWTSLLKQICKLADIDKPISPHELRHTYATICISKAVNPLAVSKMMGHASIDETYSTYIHLLKTIENEAIEVIENLIAS